MDQVMMAQLRTLLAAERTFLAWIRTGLSVIAGGLAVVKLIPFANPNHIWVAHISGQVLIGWGCVTLVVAFLNYRRSAATLAQDEVPQTPLLVFVSLTVVLVMVGLFVFWLTI